MRRINMSRRSSHERCPLNNLLSFARARARSSAHVSLVTLLPPSRHVFILQRNNYFASTNQDINLISRKDLSTRLAVFFYFNLSLHDSKN